MKTIATLLLVLSVLCVYAQDRLSIGIKVEGFWFMPHDQKYFGAVMDNSIGAGTGVYFSGNIWKTFSVNTGVGYRFMSNDCTKTNFSAESTSPADRYSYNQNCLVVPFNLRKNYFNGLLFVEPGFELDWIMGRENREPKHELLWKIGLGSHLGKLEYSLNYLWGSKQQEDMLIEGIKFAPVIYKSRLVQLTVSYPLWGKK